MCTQSGKNPGDNPGYDEDRQISDNGGGARYHNGGRNLPSVMKHGAHSAYCPHLGCSYKLSQDDAYEKRGEPARQTVGDCHDLACDKPAQNDSNQKDCQSIKRAQRIDGQYGNNVGKPLLIPGMDVRGGSCASMTNIITAMAASSAAFVIFFVSAFILISLRLWRHIPHFPRLSI